MEIPRFVVIDKAVGETPLQCMEGWRQAQPAALADIPLTYAGRLDPMASGKLLVLIGEECKKKDDYLALDKTYEFSVLFGIGSDTHDVLGRLTTSDVGQPVTMRGKSWPSDPERPEEELTVLKEQLDHICKSLTGSIELPYPHFSSKTVDGKPLFQWTLEDRLNEIDIPTKQSTIYSLELDRIETLTRADICNQARVKIDTIPEVTAEQKALGADFRRVDIRADWENIKAGNLLPRETLGRVSAEVLPDIYTIAHFTCRASSGTYMRTLAKIIGEQLDPPCSSLAWSIHRTKISDLI